jgi:hypothetical protein
LKEKTLNKQNCLMFFYFFGILKEFSHIFLVKNIIFSNKEYFKEKNMPRFNRCIFNHPCPIFCPLLSGCSENTVVNPTIADAFGFFSNTVGGEVGSQSIIPLTFVQGNGAVVQSSTTGAVEISAGTYQVTYLAGGTVPASGTLSIKLRLDGFDVTSSTLNGTQTSTNFVNLTQSIVISVSQTSVLELVNNSSTSAKFSYASMVIRSV